MVKLIGINILLWAVILLLSFYLVKHGSSFGLEFAFALICVGCIVTYGSVQLIKEDGKHD